ncbi:hypothetical protein [Mesorhizobium sp.]|uniref:hypothetical protein n=1 Tax=Mesorhizobium sp. TaxID=1871066 RepID=UPI000FE7C76B|nr:hypothetical protein [Mesorhizobium sp.]RWC64264.1 MAG: hypothetical protein EOS56_00860 [Mesorhizobium sp.]RWC67132.1 MAG: hypothetical protein EOS29_01690 [Mesorhizobium sp.]
MPLRLVIENATPEGLSRGIAAAEAVFEGSGISYDDAMTGMLAIELWDMKGFPEGEAPSEEKQTAASVWFLAERAACEACCAGWPEERVVRHRALAVGPGEPKVKTLNPTTWPERQKLYPAVIERLETAAGPDRQLDIDICYVMGWVNEPGTPEEAAKLGLPYLTSNLAEVAQITQKSLQGWTVEIEQDPCDARIIDPERDEDDDDRSVAAWHSLDGRLYMDRPPANTAIALTLAAMRLQADSFSEQSW